MFSKAPNRKVSVTGNGVPKRTSSSNFVLSKRNSKKLLAEGLSKKTNLAAGSSVKTKHKAELPPTVVFVTIDPALETIVLNSPQSPKAEAARKMFSAHKQ